LKVYPGKGAVLSSFYSNTGCNLDTINISQIGSYTVARGLGLSSFYNLTADNLYIINMKQTGMYTVGSGGGGV